MHRWLWTAGVLLVVAGLAAHAMGWDAVLWLPRAAFEALVWLPQAAVDAVRAEPTTYGVVAAGLALMLLARLLGRHRG